MEQMRADILQYFADGNPVRVRPHLSPHENDSSVLVMKSELMHGREVLNAIMSACTKSNQLEPAALIRVTSVGMKASLAEMQEMLRGLVDNRDYQFHRNNYDISFTNYSPNVFGTYVNPKSRPARQTSGGVLQHQSRHIQNYEVLHGLLDAGAFGHTVTVKFPPNKSAGNRPSTAAVLNMVSIDVIQVHSFLFNNYCVAFTDEVVQFFLPRCERFYSVTL